MFKKSFILRNVVAIAISLAGVTMFSGCDPNENDPPAISVGDGSSLTQQVYADNTEGSSGVSFTTTGAWASSITILPTPAQSQQMRAQGSATDWISIDPDHGNSAGPYTIDISLEPNETGTDRTAIITIYCNGTEIKITVTQKGITEAEGGETPTSADVRLVKRIDFYNRLCEPVTEHIDGSTTGGDCFDAISEFASFTYDAQKRITESTYDGRITYSYPNANTIIMYDDGESITHTLNNDGSLATVFNGVFSLTYSNGYLQKLEGVAHMDTDGGGNGGYESDYVRTNTWNNGNIVSMTETYTYPTVPQFNRTSTYAIEYGATLNKPISVDLVNSLMLDADLGGMFYGWFGKSTQNLPTKITYKSQSGSESYTQITHYRYETDSEGYVVKIFVRDEYENGGEQLHATITYQ